MRSKSRGNGKSELRGRKGLGGANDRRIPEVSPKEKGKVSSKGMRRAYAKNWMGERERSEKKEIVGGRNERTRTHENKTRKGRWYVTACIPSVSGTGSAFCRAHSGGRNRKGILREKKK